MLTRIPENKKAAEYIRCSTEQQEDSPEQQKRENHTFAAKHGYEIVASYVDFGKSGTTFTQRPEFLRMLHDVESGAAIYRTVICYDESRWGRAIDSEENTYWRVHFAKFGVKVILVKTAIDPDHEYAPMLKAFESIQASQYSKKLSELTLRGAKNNGVYSNGGTAPYGYVRVAVNLRTGTDRVLHLGEWCVAKQEKVRWGLGAADEVDVVRFIFNERARGRSYILIANDLNVRDISCPRRGRWRNRDQKWCSATIKAILDNPAYYGAREYNRNSMSQILAKQNGRPVKKDVNYPHWLNDRKDWVVAEDAHPAIITKDVWEAAYYWTRQKLGSEKKSVNRYTFRSQYLLSGLIKCPLCGFNYQGWSGKADGKLYFKYIDGGWQNKRVCSYHWIPKKEIEDATLTAIKETLANPFLTREIESQLEYLYQNVPQKKEVREKVESLLAEIDEKVGNWVKVIESGNAATPSDVALTRIRELGTEKRKLADRILELEQEVERPDFRSVTDQVSEFLAEFKDRIERDVPMEEKKLLVKKIISAIIIDRHKHLARMYVRRLPVVTPALARAYQNKKALTEIPVSAASSGGRT